jgi:hypothetical protein
MSQPFVSRFPDLRYPDMLQLQLVPWARLLGPYDLPLYDRSPITFRDFGVSDVEMYVTSCPQDPRFSESRYDVTRNPFLIDTINGHDHLLNQRLQDLPRDFGVSNAEMHLSSISRSLESRFPDMTSFFGTFPESRDCCHASSKMDGPRLLRGFHRGDSRSPVMTR